MKTKILSFLVCISILLSGISFAQTPTTGSTTSQKINVPLMLKEQGSTPATPQSGYDKLYFKTDGYLYRLSDGGVETNISAGQATEIPDYTVATLPASPTLGQLAYVTDGNSGTDCVSGEGAFKVLCIYNGSAWVTTSITGAGTGDVLGPATNTADKIPQWSGADSKTLKDGLTLSTDGALGTSDTTIPSQKAIKTYADTMVTKATYNAQTILAATSDDTPAALTVGEQTVVGRATGGNIAALSIDSDISSVSANDDTVPSAKATKTYADTKQTSDATLTSLAGLSGVQGDIIYASGSDAYAVLNKDANATRYLSNTGTSNNPAWAQVNLANGVTGTLPLANGGTGVAFTDPNADRIMVWDDSAGSLAWMSLGTGLSISATPSLDLDADLVTLAGLTVTRGDLIVGSSSPAWTDLAIGSANTVLITDGSDPSWGTITSAMITDNTITASDLAATLTFAATDLVDFSSMVRTGNSQDYGIVLPAWANFTPATKVGWITWDTSAKSIKVYDAGWKEFATAAAPITSTYVTVTDETATLTGSRYLVAGTAVDFTDGGAASTFTIGVDTTEIGTTTYGAGSAITTTYDASAGTDCTQAWGDNTTTLTCGTVNVAGAISSSGAITPSSANGAALGSATYEWADLFLHDGAVIYGQADQSATLTSSASLWTANNFAVTGYLAIGSDPADAGSIRLPNAGYIYSEADAAGTDISVIGVDSGEIIQIGASGASGVTITPALTVVGAILPSVSNTPALGSTSLMWADLFLGSGAVINFNNDVTLTHGSNVLTLGGGDLALGANNLTYTGYIASGSDPADAGAIRLSNADNITWEASAAGTDVVGISVDASEVVQIGSSGASAVTITPNTTVSGTLTSTGDFTANANATFGNADTDTLTLRSLLVGGNSRAVWIAGSAPTPSYATATNELYVAGDIETAGNIYATSIVTGAGTDTQRRVSMTSNTSFDCATYPDSLYFVSDAFYWCQSTSAKTPMKLEDTQTATGKKTFQADIAVGDASNAGSIDIYDGSSNYVTLQTGTMSADYTMVFPTGAGTTGQYLKTTTSGTTATLSWDTPTASADTTGGTGGVQFNAAGVLTSDAGFVFNTTTDKLSLGSSGGSTTGTIDLYYTGTTYAATITPNASMASDITITLPAGTSTLIGSGANTYTGNQTLDDGVGDSPAIVFTDATDQTTTLSKVDNSFFKIVNSAGGIALQPSGDTDDYLLVTTATNVPTIATVGNANLTFDVANSGATSTFTITNSDGTYTANLSVEGTITGGGATFTGGTNTFNITNGTASLDVAAGAAVNIDTGLTVDTAAVTLKGKSGGSTLTLPTALDLDETMTDANLCKFTESGTKISCDVAQTTFQASDAELTAIAGLTFADASIIQLTGAAAAAVLTSGGNNYILGSNSDNTALEFKTPANVLSQIGAQASDTDLTTWAGITPGANVGTFLATPSSSNLATAVTDETGSGALVFGTSPSITTSLLPAAATATIGSAAAEWGNVYLTDAGIIYFGADQDVRLEHVADTGLLLSDASGGGTTQLQFGDSGTYINQSSDGVLNVATDTELKFLINDEDIKLTKTGTDGITIGTNTSVSTITSALIFNHPLKATEVDGHTDQTSLTAANVSGTTIYNTGQGAADVFLLLPVAAAGYSFVATVGTAQTNHFGVEAAANDKIYLIAADGTVAAGDDNAAVVMTAAQVGQSFACWTFKTDAYDWMCKAISIGTSTFAAHAHSTP